MVIDGGDDFYGMSIEDKECVGVVGGWLPNHLTPLDGPWTPIGPIAPPLDRLYLSRYVQVRVKNKHGRLGYYRWKHKSTSSARSGRQWRTHGAQIESPSSTGAEGASTAAPASSCLMASKTGNKASHSFSMAREWAMRMLA